MATMFANINQSAPWWYKRLETGLIAVLIPSYTAMITALPLADSKKVFWLAGGAFFGAIVKFVGVLMGSPINGNGNGKLVQ